MEAFYVFLPLFLALYIFTKHFFGKIRNLPPSPFLRLPIIGHLCFIKKPLYKGLADIASRYGPVVMLDLGSRNVLLVSSPSAAEETLIKNDVIFSNRPRMIAGKYLGYDYTSLVWAPYGNHWRNLRKVASAEIFSSRRLEMIHEIRADEVKLTLRRIFVASLAKQSRVVAVDAKTLIFELTLNIMMRMIAGKRYYGHENSVEEEVEEVKRFRKIVAETAKYCGVSNAADFLPILRWLKLDQLDSKLRVLQEKRDRFMQDLIDEFKMMKVHHQKREKNKTLMEVLLDLQAKEPEYYTDESIKSLMLVLLATGTDTSTATIEWALSLLLNNPSLLKNSREEIDTVIGHDRLLNESDIVNLPYLRSIVMETLRMYPGGPLLPRISSQESVISGFRVPKGTMLLINMWAIQNNPRIWEDPRKFKPERFERIDSTKDIGLKWLPFGSGRRGCAGESLAMRTITFTLGSLIQCFEWEKIGPKMIDMTEGPGLSMPKVQPLIASCQPRSQMVHHLLAL